MAAGSGIFTNKLAFNPHLLQGGGLPYEVKDLRQDITDAFSPMAASYVEEFTAPSAAATASIKTAIATVAAATTYSGAALNGTIGAAVMSPPRNITITTAGGTPADAPATATINGLDVDGNALSETITVSQTAATATGSKMFAQVTSIVLPAADGVNATLAFGHGALLGLSKKVKTRCTVGAMISAIEGTAVVLTGSVKTAVANPPYGAFSPTSAPNGTLNYTLYYEGDPT